MTSLSAAADFLRRTARPLELCAYECLFEGASHDGFVAALRAFQRPDGGFGGALEPVDFALKSLHQVGARSTELGARACGFLRAVSEPGGELPYLLPSALAHPRADHWKTLQAPSLGLTYGIAGLLHWLRVDDSWLDAATDACWQALREPPGDATALIGVMLFLEHAPPRPERDARIALLRTRLPAARWLSIPVPFEGYAVTPLDLAPRPDAFARAFFGDATIEAHLDALAARQQDDGGWPLSWDPPGNVTLMPVGHIVIYEPLTAGLHTLALDGIRRDPDPGEPGETVHASVEFEVVPAGTE